MDKKVKIIIILIILVIAGYSIFYMTDYYHAESDAVKYLNGSGNVSVVKISNGLFVDGSGNENAVIFYPGAKIEYISYLPMLVQLAENGVDCYIVEMPFNLAVLAQDSADDIIDSTNYTHYYMAGHSLGGVASASYTNSSDTIDGLILLASYPTEDINVDVLSIYGSNDKVLNMKKYNESKSFIKRNFTEFVINGANHAQFGFYGNQSGDGAANISALKQQNESVNKILEFINT